MLNYINTNTLVAKKTWNKNTLSLGSVSAISFLADFGDVPFSYQLGFQDPATPIMEGIIDLHHDIFFFLIMVVIFVSWMVTRTIVLFKPRDSKITSREDAIYLHNVPFNVTHDTVLEVVWTIIPSLILVLISIPSFALLYSVDEVIDPEYTVKIIGNQWYWVYEYPPLQARDRLAGYDNVRVESYMLGDGALQEGYFRTLEVDNGLYLPVKTHMRLLITARDVLHSFAVPSLGLKMDACPGRLNQTTCYILREGTYYGQCSEICGINHAFMPIMVKAVDSESFYNYLINELHVFSGSGAKAVELPSDTES